MLRKANLIQSRTICTLSRCRHRIINRRKKAYRRSRPNLLRLMEKRKWSRIMPSLTIRRKVINDRVSQKKVQKYWFKTNRKAHHRGARKGQRKPRNRMLYELRKKVNRMKERNELRLERGVKDTNQPGEGLIITVGRNPITIKGNTPSFKGLEEVKRRSKKQMELRTIQEGLRQPNKMVIRSITLGKGRKGRVNDLRQRITRLRLSGQNQGTIRHSRSRIPSLCPIMLMLRNLCIKKKPRRSKIR